MLHGRSGSENAMWVLARVLPEGWLVVAPRGLAVDPRGGYAWHPRRRDEWPPLREFDPAVDKLSAFLRSLPDLYDADDRQIYLMGFSQGAATAYGLAMRHPGDIKGIAGLVGFVPIESNAAAETRSLEGLPIFMAVGRRDPYIPLQRSSRCAATLRQSGAVLDYHEYDTGHRLNVAGMADLKAWWLARANDMLRRD